MKTYKNFYFKQGQTQISGINLTDEMIKESEFIDCDFHPNTWDLEFEGCIFMDCSVENDLTKHKSCEFIGSYK